MAMDSLTKFINRISRCGILYREKKLSKYGLNGVQHAYLLNICRNPGISQENLAKLIFVNKSNVARQLALLEENGFITREPCENDKRQMSVFPTQKAIDTLPKVIEVLDELNGKLLEDFSDEERRLLISMMERVTDKAIKLIDESFGDREE
jgi:DNA-binding MarR family transcriptional regulator